MAARRLLLAALAAAFLCGPALAADRVVTVPVKKLFPYLEAYLGLPAADRDRFFLSYRLTMDGAPSPLLRVAFLAGAQRTPLAVDADGFVRRPPGLAVLRSDQKVEVAMPEGHKLNLALEIQPSLAPAAEMDARALAAACVQATAGAKKAAGVMGFVAPRLDRVVFRGAAGGQVVTASGRSAALPVVKGSPVLDPAAWPDARLIRFSRAPSLVVLGKAG